MAVSAKSSELNPEEWPKMPRLVNEAAKHLDAQYREEGIPADVLMREVERIGGYARGSVLPSDYCYNQINRSAFSFKHPVLVHVQRARYKYVGPDADYTGLIYWKPKHGQEQQVGSWNDGKCQLDVDPRQHGHHRVNYDYANTDTGKEWAGGFGAGAGLHGDVGLLWRAG